MTDLTNKAQLHRVTPAPPRAAGARTVTDADAPRPTNMPRPAVARPRTDVLPPTVFNAMIADRKAKT